MGSEFDDYAATLIQKTWRGYSVRKRVKKQRDAVRRICTFWLRSYRGKKRPSWAVPVIQRTWRAFSQRRIFKYYRDLIKFRERGNPQDLLRCINFREAQLCDVAAGTHVRFRLGGNTFPPLVFYKIYTHNSITDINSFCPRDYAGEKMQVKDLIKVHNYRSKAGELYDDFALAPELLEYRKHDGTVGYRNEMGWYRRSENNGWRPVAERALVEAEEITHATSRSRMAFHHIPQQRKAELVRRRKQKKREWMTKLYLLGKEGRAVGSDGKGGGLGMEEEELFEDEDILKWTENLDFDDYLDNWTRMATSNSTEAYIPVPDSLWYEEEEALVQADSAALFAQNYISSEPFKNGTGVATVNFRAADLRS